MPSPATLRRPIPRLIGVILLAATVLGATAAGAQAYNQAQEVAAAKEAARVRALVVQNALAEDRAVIVAAQRRADREATAAARAEHAQILAARDTLVTAQAPVLEASKGKADESLRAALSAAVDELAAAGTVHSRIAAATAKVTAASAQVVASQQAWEKAEAARIAAAKAEAARIAAAKAAAAKTAATRVAWRTYVANSGGQSAVDRCSGGLTRWFERVDGKTYYPIHRHCGGSPILGLSMGARVQIGSTVYVVSDIRVVSSNARYSSVSGMRGSALLQTCYAGNARMRVVALSPA